MKSREKGTNKEGVDGNVEAARDSLEELRPEERPRDARGNPEQQQGNREKMGVTEEHKTEKMKEERRGTYP